MKIKYLQNGQEVEVVEETKTGILVRTLYEDHENGGFYPSEEIEVVSTVFDQPPVARYYEEIKRLEARIVELNATRREVEKQAIKAKQDADEMFMKFKGWEQLKFLEKYLDNKITHFFTLQYEWNPDVVAFYEFMRADKQYDHGMKLLSLYGGSKGDLQWRVNQYSDGSGDSIHVTPFFSYEEACDKLRKYIYSRITELPKEGFVKVAAKHGISLPDEYIESCKEINRRGLRNNIKECHDKIINYTKKLDELG